MNRMQTCLVASIAAAMSASLPMATQTFAQEPSRPRLSQTDWNALTTDRIAVVKAALQLTPEQEKYWPAIEKAMRTRGEARESRISRVEERLSEETKVDPIELLHGRADALAQRATNLKDLADAWQPLYQTLNPDQKRRMRLLVADVLRDVRDAVEERHMETTGQGTGMGR